MKVQLKVAEVKPITIRLKPGDVAVVLRQEKGKPLPKAHFFYGPPYGTPPQQTEVEEVSIGVGSRGQAEINHSGIYRVSEWR
ncbi:MAG: hypothetical protein HY094_08940 [Candidatus Melainabacteria bacterium]|nr:hypothetical protein [Candidatus Melainabacteria bacterium]